MFTDGSAPTNLSNSDADDNTPSWSPVDSNLIAITSNRGGDYDVYTLRVDTGEVFRLTGGYGDEQYPSWSPDGDALVFVSNEASQGGQFALYQLDTDGQRASNLVQLTFDDGENWAPSW
jgi:Tol biopolymer transport system component